MRSNYKKISFVCVILMLSMIISLVAFPVHGDAPVYSKATHPILVPTPNPIGVDQEVLIWLGITDELQAAADGWENITVTVTRPDGETEELGPFRTDSTGSTGAAYTPRLVGTYYLQLHFPGQWFNWTAPPVRVANVWYESSQSEIVELEVREEPRQYYPGSPPPTEYWSRPIDAQHREWSVLAGNWLEQTPPNFYAPYNKAPETGHILWTKPLSLGGLTGGEHGPHAFECGDAYEGKFLNSVIIGGTLFYNKYEARGGANVEQEVVAVDLRTGEELWIKNWDNRRLAFGQVFYWDSYNYHGVFGYLWSTVGSTWHAYDPLTGRWVYSMTGVPSGTNVYGPNGEIYRYTINLANGWMTLWNSSRVVSNEGSWRPHGNTYSVSWDSPRQGGYEWNKTIPEGLTGNIDYIFFEDRVIGTTTDSFRIPPWDYPPIRMWAISLKPGEEGTLLFDETWERPPGNIAIDINAASIEDGVFLLTTKETREHYGFDIDTGELVWGPTEPQVAPDFLNIHVTHVPTHRSVIAYGKFFSANMGGVAYAYNASTGELLWTYEAVDKYTEILWSDNWPLHIVLVTDEKIYLRHSEHSPIDPKPRGAPFICLDVETGEEIWSLNIRGHEWGGDPIIGDSIIAMYNSYDQQIYAIGKGPTTTSVTAPNVGVAAGSSVLIKGSVIDSSSGTQDSAITARFPHGVAAVADESMSEWMQYVYMQFPRPVDVQGVEVTLTIRDPMGEYYVTTTTTDANGLFHHAWAPTRPGSYYVTAEFKGSESYWPSSHSTAFILDEAAVLPAPVDPTPPPPVEPTPTPPPVDEPTPTPPPDEVPAPDAPAPMTWYIIVAAVVVIAAVIATAVLLKKRK